MVRRDSQDARGRSEASCQGRAAVGKDAKWFLSLFTDEQGTATPATLRPRACTPLHVATLRLALHHSILPYERVHSSAKTLQGGVFKESGVFIAQKKGVIP